MPHAHPAPHSPTPRVPLAPWPLPRVSALAAALGNILLDLYAQGAAQATVQIAAKAATQVTVQAAQGTAEDATQGAARRAPWTGPWAVEGSGLTAFVRPLPFAPDVTISFVPACLGTLVWRGHIWKWELNSLRPLRLHPALRTLPPDELARMLPPEVRLTALELLLEPLVHALENLLHDTVTLRDVRFSEGDAPSLCAEAALTLEVLLDAGEGLRETFLCCLTPHQGEGGRALLHTLPKMKAYATAAPCALHSALLNMAVPVSVLAGYVRLGVDEVAALAHGDVLLPDDFPAARGRVLLCPPTATSPTTHGGTTRAGKPGESRYAKQTDQTTKSGCPLRAFPCTLTGNTLTVDGPLVTPSPEHPMTQDTAYIPENTQGATKPETPSAVMTDLLQVELRFELERRSMTVAEIGALEPGSVLTLTADTASPVTLIAGDTVLGQGRLVDVEGFMGVQITTLATSRS